MLFTTEQFIASPLQRVFEFFAAPHNLLRISSPSSKLRIERVTLVAPSRPAGITTFAPLAGTGSEILISSRLAFLPVRTAWTARIVEFEWYRYFIDVQERGPFRQWRHTHFFEAAHRDDREGTIVRDQVEWEVGFGIAHRLAEAVARRQIESVFRYRHKAAAKLLEA